MPRRKTVKRRPLPPLAPEESRLAEALTVGWVVAALSTLVCELATVAARLYLRQAPYNAPIAALADLTLFAALAIGIFTLLLTPMVLKLRRLPPPRGVTTLAVAIGLAPLATIAWQVLWQSTR
jgi:hypothetical protein